MKAFMEDQDGAITVDWVVLTAAVVGLQVILLLTPIRESLVGVSESIGDGVDEYNQFLVE